MMAKQRRSVSRFHEREVARALRAARLAGERPDRVEIDPKTGKISVVIAKPGEVSPPHQQQNEWDEEAK